VNVVVVYIKEAHARDVWPIGDAVSSTIDAPRSDHDRCAIAHRMRTELCMDLPIFVDNINDTFEMHFAAWPFRFYIVDQNAQLRYKAQPNKELTHCPVELECALEMLMNQ
jgi:hypothetical protein